LLERTTVNTAREVRKAHAQRLRDNKHLRYMWIPSTDTVVVVTCNEVAEVRVAEGWRRRRLMRLMR
jgi:L-galactono-1,4-lactone dehydrogenase